MRADDGRRIADALLDRADDDFLLPDLVLVCRLEFIYHPHGKRNEGHVGGAEYGPADLCGFPSSPIRRVVVDRHGHQFAKLLVRVDAGGFPSGSTVELIVVSLVSFWFLTIGSSMAWVARAAGQNSWGGLTSRFVNELRLIAREPLPDPKDPRFKKWNVNESMPMSAYVKSYPERKQPEWGQRLGGLAGRQLGRGWARWQRRGKS